MNFIPKVHFFCLCLISCTEGSVYTVKSVLSGNSKIDKTKVLKTNGSLMKVEIFAECSLEAFCKTFYLH